MLLVACSSKSSTPPPPPAVVERDAAPPPDAAPDAPPDAAPDAPPAPVKLERKVVPALGLSIEVPSDATWDGTAFTGAFALRLAPGTTRDWNELKAQIVPTLVGEHILSAWGHDVLWRVEWRRDGIHGLSMRTLGVDCSVTGVTADHRDAAETMCLSIRPTEQPVKAFVVLKEDLYETELEGEFLNFAGAFRTKAEAKAFVAEQAAIPRTDAPLPFKFHTRVAWLGKFADGWRLSMQLDISETADLSEIVTALGLE